MASKIDYMKMTVLCLCLSFVAQLIGFAAPGWLHVEIFLPYGQYIEQVASQNFALWYVVICWRGTCSTKLYAQLQQDRSELSGEDYWYDDDNYSSDYDFTAKDSKFPFSKLKEYQIEATCALVIAFLAILLVRKQKNKYLQYISGKRQEEPRRSRLCVSFCYALVSGTLILIPSSKFVHVNLLLKRIATDNLNIRRIGTPYALISSGVGGIFAVLSALFILAAMCKSIRNGEHGSRENNGVVLADSEADGNLLVALAPVEIQTHTSGYVDPAVPGYIPTYETTTDDRTLTTTLNTTANYGHENLEEAVYSHTLLTDQDYGTRSFEQPPPSYEEVMQQQYNEPP